MAPTMISSLLFSALSILSSISHPKYHAIATKHSSLRQAGQAILKDKIPQADNRDGVSRDKKGSENLLDQIDSSEFEAEVSDAETTTYEVDMYGSGAKVGNFLFDLASDPYESINLLNSEDTSQYEETISYFRKRQKYWASLMKDPEIPTDNGNKYSLFRENNNGYCAYNEVDFEPVAVTTKYAYADAPHIVFVLIDDWGYNDVGFRSTYMNWTTPTIDQLAREGTLHYTILAHLVTYYLSSS